MRRVSRGGGRPLRFEAMEPRCLLSATLTCGVNSQDTLVQDLQAEIGTAALPSSPTTNWTPAVNTAAAVTAQVRAQFGLTGEGQTVAVIDTGIAYDHVALGGGFGAEYRVVGGYDFAENDANPYDDGPLGGHGTHVAGILDSTATACPGIAPGADLVALRVFDDSGHGEFAWVEEALQWVHAHRNDFEHPITAVNLSLGGAWNADSAPSWAMLEDELAQLAADGIFVAVAAGNSFTTYNQPGVSYPAASQYVVPVASVDADGALSYFSQRNDRVIAAPGRAVLSTVPDYLGNQNGIADDYAQFSGTSMAAPYVAGASVLLRQACEVAGVTNVTAKSLYDIMVNTSDTVFDPVTGKNYHRLNLEHALELVLPVDGFGSTAATAYDLGAVSAKASISGMTERLGDVDCFRFTASESGTARIRLDGAAGTSAHWRLSDLTAQTTAAGDTLLSFKVVAGKSYVLGVGADGLGRYALNVDIQAEATTTDWGPVVQSMFANQVVPAAGRQFGLTASRDGILTVEPLQAGQAAGGNVVFRLYRANGQLAGESPAGGSRIDVVASAGERFVLKIESPGATIDARFDFRVTNLVSQVGTTVRVGGTVGDDQFVFRAGMRHEVVINGTTYTFDAAKVRLVQWDGGAGQDSAVLYGTNGAESVTLRPGEVDMVGSGYQVHAVGVEDVAVDTSGGYDRAVFQDSTGDDTFTAGPGYATMSGVGFHNRVEHCRSIYATVSGGNDTAQLQDSAGSDMLVMTPTCTTLSGASFFVRVTGFDKVAAQSTKGVDVGVLYDSPGNDLFSVSAGKAVMRGPGYENQAQGFASITAWSTAGGADRAEFAVNPTTDRFTQSGGNADLTSARQQVRARYFEEIARLNAADALPLAAIESLVQSQARAKKTTPVAAVDALFAQGTTWL